VLRHDPVIASCLPRSPLLRGVEGRRAGSLGLQHILTAAQSDHGTKGAGPLDDVHGKHILNETECLAFRHQKTVTSFFAARFVASRATCSRRRAARRVGGALERERGGKYVLWGTCGTRPAHAAPCCAMLMPLHALSSSSPSSIILPLVAIADLGSRWMATM